MIKIKTISKTEYIKLLKLSKIISPPTPKNKIYNTIPAIIDGKDKIINFFIKLIMRQVFHFKPVIK